MSLPSPPISRSSSQSSVSRKPATYDPSFAPASPAESLPCTSPAESLPCTPPVVGKVKPALTLKPLTTPAAPRHTFLASAQTPYTADSDFSALQSVFSPCTDSEDDSDDEQITMATKDTRTRGHFQRLWASREPPSMPPSDPPPAIPRRLSFTPSPTFGGRRRDSNSSNSSSNSSNNGSPREFMFSPGSSAPCYFSPRRPSRLSKFSMYPPSAPSAPPTGVYPPSPWGESIMSSVNSPTIQTPSDPLLQNLQKLLSAKLESLSSIFTAPPPADLAIARAERDRLMVRTQKAYFRRTPAEAVEEMQIELREMEERVKVLERDFVQSFLGAMDGFVEGVKAGCKGFMGEEEPEIIEMQVPEQQEEETFEGATEYSEEEATFLTSEIVDCNGSTNPELRFTWTPSSFDDSEDEEEEEEEGDYYADEDEDHHLPLPLLAPDDESYQSEDMASLSSSSCESSPIIGTRGHLPDSSFSREACGCQKECGCWDSFLPPSPAMSDSSQRMISCVGPKGGKKEGSSAMDLNLNWDDMEWGHNEVVVQRVGAVEMVMI